MPKKSRRSKSKAKQRARMAKTVVEERHPQQVQPTTAKAQSPARISHEVQDFAGRYGYVMTEVKRIGIFAGSMILVIIILSFVLR